MLIHFKAQLLVDAVGPPSFLSSIFCEVYYREKDMVVCRALAFSRLAEPNYGTRKGWKALYINQHRRMDVAISNVVEFVGSSLNNGWLESECYLKAIADLALMDDIGFLDVKFFLFSRNHSAIINLIGLHYSIASLHVLPAEVSKALQARQVAGRRVCVNLLKLGRWFYGFRLPDEHVSRKISLSELTVADGAEILAILNRGAVHEVFRLQISLADIDK
ncbi:hypothetical protein GQ55_3G295600 [Panicum hallii var. hallii]|uniref:Uncharacterized protein n=1 Tax=Panicum hallii var. hallii TaxID=1504633 RepID=A0A2T7EEN1_9POAL|nr:hypothetical protein GQ55_3G295600 [Panicum hallii var. hallii]PUZ66281.1 hypothetical protein GQ55_3G295600 [Panicum hallii var. hallii]